jgi:hypothetical protein
MRAQDLIQTFAAQAGISGLALNSAGRARLVVDGDLTVEMEHEAAGDILHLYAAVGTMPPQPPAELLLRALGINLFCRETLGAALAHDAATAEFILCRQIELEGVDTAHFTRHVENFVNAALHVRTRLAAQSPGVAPVPAQDLSAFQLSAMRA